VVLQTTNNVYDQRLYELLSVRSLPSWQRVRVANMLAANGPEWAAAVSEHNSGTYNNQYMLVNLNLFTPGQVRRAHAKIDRHTDRQLAAGRRRLVVSRVCSSVSEHMLEQLHAREHMWVCEGVCPPAVVGLPSWCPGPLRMLALCARARLSVCPLRRPTACRRPLRCSAPCGSASCVQELQPGLLWVVEQIPGRSVSKDVTQTLERGYW
jgi:Phospholipase B